MNKIGLSALVSPLTSDEFMKDAWPKEPFVVHGLDKSIRTITELPFLKSLDALLNSWPLSVQAHLPDVCDESSSIEATAKDAGKLFSNHMPLLFNNIEKISPLLSDWLLQLTRDLGLPNSTHSRCLIYATPNGKGTAPHFDQNINFILQLHGTKKWWIAPNANVENPTERFTMNQELAPELASYTSGVMPTKMPADHQQINLSPGSMLFVPRGYWHSTEAIGDALALNFTFSQPTWIDLLILALRSRLSLSNDWRDLADGVGSIDVDRRLAAQQKFETLLSELREDLPSWQAADILASTEGLL